MNRELYQTYINDMAPGWTESSIRSERQRLNRLWDFIDGDAAKLWAALQHHGRYSRTTYWTRIVAFVDWAIENGHVAPPNPYRAFRKKHKRNFVGTYDRKPPTMTLEEAYRGVLKIKQEDIRNKSLQLLLTGMRRTESYTLKDGYVLGKGRKVRKIYDVPELGPMAEPKRYGAMLRALKKVGIKGPHKLRGIFLSELVRKKINPFELKKVAGWSSLATAESYIDALDDNIFDIIKSAKQQAQVESTIVQSMAAAAGTTLASEEKVSG